MADYPEVAERIKKRFKFYAEERSSPLGKLGKLLADGEESDPLTDLIKGTSGDTQLAAAERFVVLHLGYATRYEKERELSSVKVWKNLERSLWGNYGPGTLDCDFEMKSAKNNAKNAGGEPLLTASSYKIILQITYAQTAVSGSFTSTLRDWSTGQDPFSVFSGTYSVGEEGASKFKLTPFPIPEIPPHRPRRKPKQRTG